MLSAPVPRQPGEGPHWDRLTAWLRDRLPVDEIDGIWVFRVLRHDPREFGAAVLSRVDGERRRIYTASYTATIKGKQRGNFEPQLTEVGSGPREALQALLALVPVRAEDEEPPVEVPCAQWFAAVAVADPSSDVIPSDD
jgi:hypothetical protein